MHDNDDDRWASGHRHGLGSLLHLRSWLLFLHRSIPSLSVPACTLAGATSLETSGKGSNSRWMRNDRRHLDAASPPPYLPWRKLPKEVASASEPAIQLLWPTETERGSAQESTPPQQEQ